jgi:hypothetical protein
VPTATWLVCAACANGSVLWLLTHGHSSECKAGVTVRTESTDVTVPFFWFPDLQNHRMQSLSCKSWSSERLVGRGFESLVLHFLIS